jgi:TolA-binding protein
VYPDSRVSEFINQHFVPVRLHVKEQADDYKRVGGRYNQQWTPTILIVDASGTERHRIEGYLPVEDFLGQLALGLAQSAFARSDFKEAESLFRTVVDNYPTSDAAPEALYWAGVSHYKATGDAAALADTAVAFGNRYQDTSWAKKSSVWGAR